MTEQKIESNESKPLKKAIGRSTSALVENTSQLDDRATHGPKNLMRSVTSIFETRRVSDFSVNSSENENDRANSFEYYNKHNLNGRSSVPSDIFRENSNFKNDWSNKSSNFLKPFKEFLIVQKQHERECLRRCNENYKGRLSDFEAMEKERKLREFDEKIRLKLLLKKVDKKNNISQNNSASNKKVPADNYRILIAKQLALQNKICERCTSRNKKHDQNFDGCNTDGTTTNVKFPSLQNNGYDTEGRRTSSKLSYTKSFNVSNRNQYGNTFTLNRANTSKTSHRSEFIRA